MSVEFCNIIKVHSSTLKLSGLFCLSVYLIRANPSIKIVFLNATQVEGLFNFARFRAQFKGAFDSLLKVNELFQISFETIVMNLSYISFDT